VPIIITALIMSEAENPAGTAPEPPGPVKIRGINAKLPARFSNQFSGMAMTLGGASEVAR
jgi:hypothetical protein